MRVAQPPPNHFCLNAYNFLNLAKEEGCLRSRSRLLILHHLQQGKSSSQIAEMFEIDSHTVCNIRRNYWHYGLERAIYDLPRSGRRRFLPPDQEEAFKKRVQQLQKERAYDILTVKEIRELARDEFGVNYTLQGMYSLLRRLNLSPQSKNS